MVKEVVIQDGAVTQPDSNVSIDDDGELTTKGRIINRTATATDYTTTVTDYYIGVTNTAVPRTITLASATVKAGRKVVIKDESGGAGSNNITIATEGAETIDGLASVAIASDYASFSLVCDGTNWFVV